MRQGCLLTPHPDKTATWMMVNRDGTRVPILLTRENALAYASAAAEQFGVRKDIRILDFEKDRAEKDLRKKDLAEASKKK
jgi:CRISPR-associated protein Csb1